MCGVVYKWSTQSGDQGRHGDMGGVSHVAFQLLLLSERRQLSPRAQGRVTGGVEVACLPGQDGIRGRGGILGDTEEAK